MKRLVAVLLMFCLLLIILCGCNDVDTASSDISNSSKSDDNSENTDSSTEIYRDHQELTASEIIFDENNMMRISIPEVGLENVFELAISDLDKICVEGYGRVHILGDDRYGGGKSTSDLYLAIEYDDKLFIKDLSKWENNATYSVDLKLSDVNGDEDKEIILIMCTGPSNMSRIFDFENGKIVEIFCSSIMENFDTGFSITILENKKFIIENRFTNYSQVFHDNRKSDEYYNNFWYDENGKPLNLEISVNPFNEFLPDDIDQDGVCEIICSQYVSLIGHSDGIGTAKTILKYNKDTQQFEIISSQFELF